MSSSTDPTSLDWFLGEVSLSGYPVVQHTDSRFRDKVVVITGAGGQLGRQGCHYFGKRGARVIAIDKNSEALRETFSSLNQHCEFKPYALDVTDAEAVEAVFQHIAQRYKRIDYLWNNAGYQGQIAPILEQKPSDFALVMQINVTGLFCVLQATAKIMKETGGAIVNTASVAGLRGTPAMVGYASSKAAVIALTVTAAKELAVYNIRVNAISPALIGPGPLWERQNKLHAQVGAPYFAETEEEVGAAKVNSVPMKRLGTAEEVVQSVAFLFSDDASYTTGINLTVDGGMAAGLKA